MKTRLLLLLTVIIAVPVLAQHNNGSATATNVSAVTTPVAPTPPPQFIQLKPLIDSLTTAADNDQMFDHAVFNGRARIGKYRVECYYNIPNKEIIKTAFLFVTDSLNFRKTFYYKNNTVIKVTENDSATYYQISDKYYTDQGMPVGAVISKMLMGVIADTWQGLYLGLFPQQQQQ